MVLQISCQKGSPPRMRGQVEYDLRFNAACRITPADAGTSAHDPQPLRLWSDHPRGCGDKLENCKGKEDCYGSPPRMRGQAEASPACVVWGGITPADAGTRAPSLWRPHGAEDHPRGCGDKAYNDGWIGSKWGSPPRMRGQGILEKAHES